MSRLADCTETPRAFRHELKYIISTVEKEQLRSRLSGMLQQDSNAQPDGIYKIRSLYFDDYWNNAYYDKLKGINSRYKYRIRIYNDSDRVIHLERKIKQGNYIAKESARLSKNMVVSIMRGEYQPLLRDEQELCRKFYYACTTELYRPRVMVDYEREPYIYPAGDVRITFDTNVRAGLWNLNLFDDKLPTINVLDPDLLILEVKYTELLPSFIQAALPIHSGAPMAVSKYVLGCDRTIYAAR